MSALLLPDVEGRRHNSRRIPAGARAIGLVAVWMLCIVGCAQPTPSVKPSSVPSPQSPAAFPAFAVPGAFLEVGPETTLVVFEQPSAERIIAELEPGTLLQLLDSVDGPMYKVQISDESEGTRFGWADIGGPERPLAFLPEIPFTCPADLSIGMLGGLWEPEKLICFGDRELELPVVRLGGVGVARKYSGEPAWLAEASNIVAFGHRFDSEVLAGVHLPPDIELPDPNLWVTMFGHYDDPRSRDCVRSALAPATPAQTPEDAVVWCRQQFVVSELRPTVAPSQVSSPNPEVSP